MNAKEYLDKFGKDRCTEICRVAGTSYAYFNQIAYGHRRPSVDLAQKLVDASDGELDLLALLTNKKAA